MVFIEMGIMEYIKINIRHQFPDLWKKYESTLSRGEIVGSNSFNNFLKDENINGFAVTQGVIGNAQIRTDNLMWIKLKWQ